MHTRRWFVDLARLCLGVGTNIRYRWLPPKRDRWCRVSGTNWGRAGGLSSISRAVHMRQARNTFWFEEIEEEMERLKRKKIYLNNSNLVAANICSPVRHFLICGCLAIHSLNWLSDCERTLSSSLNSSFAMSLNFDDSVHWYESYSSGFVSKLGIERLFSASNTESGEKESCKAAGLLEFLDDNQWK